MTTARRRRRALAASVLTAIALLGATSCGEENGTTDSGNETETGADSGGSGGDEGGDEPDGLVFTAEDETIEVPAGETFTIELDENQSTGFVWEVVDPQPDSAVVTFVDGRYEMDEAEDGETGVGGTRYLEFRAEEPGSTQIALEEVRGSRTSRDAVFDLTVG